MVSQNKTTMLSTDNDQDQLALSQITDFMNSSRDRGERLEERMLDKAIAEARAERLKRT